MNGLTPKQKSEITSQAIRDYLATDGADRHIIAFSDCNRVYACIINTLTEQDCKALYKLQSRNGITADDLYQLRYEQSKAKILYLRNRADKIINLCSVAELEREKAKLQNTAKTLGNALELILCKELNGKQNADSLPYDEGGDIVVNGLQYQVKYHKGSIRLKAIATAKAKRGL